jgi:hypothetical protein
MNSQNDVVILKQENFDETCSRQKMFLKHQIDNNSRHGIIATKIWNTLCSKLECLSSAKTYEKSNIFRLGITQKQ